MKQIFCKVMHVLWLFHSWVTLNTFIISKHLLIPWKASTLAMSHSLYDIIDKNVISVIEIRDQSCLFHMYIQIAVLCKNRCYWKLFLWRFWSCVSRTFRFLLSLFLVASSEDQVDFRRWQVLRYRPWLTSNDWVCSTACDSAVISDWRSE